MLRRSLTQEGMVHGTPHYMSPEQTRGDVVDARSDQFSFCAALYRRCTTHAPSIPRRWLKPRRAVGPRRPSSRSLLAG
ncbi:hypothetical protein ACN28S_66775 [Cystobacter fuscus]